MRDAHPIVFYEPNPTQRLFHESPARRRYLMGGNSSGKSYAAMGAEIAYRTTPAYDEEGNETGFAIHPHKRIKLPNIGWVSCATEEIQKEPRGGVQSYVMDFMGNQITDRTTQSGVIKDIKLKSGCDILFKTFQSGRGAYTSATVDWIAADEPHPQGVWHEMNVRLIRSKPAGDIWMAATPVADASRNIITENVIWLWEREIKPILERKEAGRHDGTGSDVWFMHMSENKAHVDMDAAYEATETMNKAEQHARRTGQYIPITGAEGFDPMMLAQLEGHCWRPEEGTVLESNGALFFASEVPGEYDENSGTVTRIWRFPEEGQDYAIGVDVGGTTDPTSATIIDMKRLEVVAEFHGWIDELGLAVELQKLGLYYNVAEIIIEVNKEGKTTANWMKHGNSDYGILKYPNLYHRAKPSDMMKGWDMASFDVGWITTGGIGTGTRDVLIGNIRLFLAHATRTMKEAADSKVSPMPSLRHLSELRTFVADSRGKLAAARGTFDDRVISLGLALQALKRHVRDPFKSEPDPVPENEAMMFWNENKLMVNPQGFVKNIITGREDPKNIYRIP